MNVDIAVGETAKEILEEIFHARPSDVEEMIQMRLEEKNWREESWHEALKIDRGNPFTS